MGDTGVGVKGGGRYSVERRDEILDVALAVLAERGYREASMREIAGRAHASKETLYSWFGDKKGLFERLISRQAEGLEGSLSRSLEPDGEDPTAVLRSFAAEMLRVLLGERAVTINRVAISEFSKDPTFARILTERGRGTVVPKLGRFIGEQRDRGRLKVRDPGHAAEVFVGLVVGDRQVRRLLGSLPEPGPQEVEARAAEAVETFLALFAPG